MLTHLYRFFRGRASSPPAKAVILIYHRVACLTVDPYWQAVTPDHFAQQMAYIRETCRPMRLLDLVEAIQEGSVPPRAVVITFDDGYVDNFTTALPILEQYELPATLFVTTGNIGAGGEYWWDELERLLLGEHSLPPCVHLVAHGHTYTWSTRNAKERWQALRAIHKLLQLMPQPEREKRLAELCRWASCHAPAPPPRPDYRPMTVEELRSMAASAYIDIGAHTVSHAPLSVLPGDKQYGEIVASVQQLEAILSDRIETFSYPHGKYTEETVEILKSIGIRGAVTIKCKLADAESDPLRLGRYSVESWPRKPFQEYLERVFMAWTLGLLHLSELLNSWLGAKSGQSAWYVLNEFSLRYGEMIG